MKGALVSGLIAQVEGEPLGVGDLAGDGVEAECLERDGAMAEPVVLGHGLDERFFGWSGGPVLFAEAGEQIVEVGLGFRGKDLKRLLFSNSYRLVWDCPQGLCSFPSFRRSSKFHPPARHAGIGERFHVFLPTKQKAQSGEPALGLISN